MMDLQWFNLQLPKQIEADIELIVFFCWTKKWTFCNEAIIKINDFLICLIPNYSQTIIRWILDIWILKYITAD